MFTGENSYILAKSNKELIWQKTLKLRALAIKILLTFANATVMLNTLESILSASFACPSSAFWHSSTPYHTKFHALYKILKWVPSSFICVSVLKQLGKFTAPKIRYVS